MMIIFGNDDITEYYNDITQTSAGDTNKYEEIAKEIGKLVTEKQEAYGDSFGNSHKILEVLYPNGIIPDQYQDLLTVVRIIDKLFRVAHNKKAFGESPYRDIAGYGILGVGMEKK